MRARLSLADDMIKHNVYFSGAVQSLNFTSDRGRATIGVMTRGNYTFATDVPEHVVITTGALAERMPGEGWRECRAGEAYDVGGHSSFEVSVDTDVTYVCYYVDAS